MQDSRGALRQEKYLWDQAHPDPCKTWGGGGGVGPGGYTLKVTPIGSDPRAREGFMGHLNRP